MGKAARLTSSFFKIMFGDFSDHLRIPPDFVKHFNKRILPKNLNLHISTGAHWVVHLKKAEKNLFLEEGWRDFVEDNSVEVGDFLVFRLVGDSVFEVVIYGNSCCEKAKATRNKNPSNCTCSKPKGKQGKAMEECSKCMFRKQSIPSGGCDDAKNGRAKAFDEAACNINAADLYFTSIFRQDIQQMLPTKFTNKLGDALSNPAFIKVPGGELCQVQLQKVEDKVFLRDGWQGFVTKQSICDGQLLVFIYSGDSCFNVLKVDMGLSDEEHLCGERTEKSANVEGNRVTDSVTSTDECEDDLMDYEVQGRRQKKENPRSTLKNKGLHKQLLGRQWKVIGPKISNPVTLKERREFKAASEFKSRHPTFIVRLASHYAQDRVLRIPSSFVRMHLPKKSTNARILVPRGRTWITQYKSYSNYRSYISKGWTEFVSENKLREGHVYAFELIDKKDIKLKISTLSR